MKELVREMTPPVLWKMLGKLRRFGQRRHKGNQDGKWTFGAEQPAEFYDETFKDYDHWKTHYTASRYYPLWTVIADRIKRRQVKRIIDIGCGPGQVACFMRDIGVDDYLGLDFSHERIAHARSVCPDCEFRETDVFDTDVFETTEYDAR